MAAAGGGGGGGASGSSSTASGGGAWGPPPPRLAAVRYVVLAGGGARGLLYPGFFAALAELHRVDFGARTQPLAGAAGTSIGALFALMLVLGFTAPQLAAAADGWGWDTVATPNPLLLLTAARAADDGTTLRASISALVAHKLGVPDVTLAELRRRCGGTALTVVATDKTACGVRYLSPATAPAMSVVDAVYASMALPLLLAPLRAPDDGHELQDGGAMDNLPLGLFPPAATLAVALHWSRDADGGSLARYAARSAYCLMYPGMVLHWAALSPAQRARVVVLDGGDIGVGTTPTPDVRARAAAAGYRDGAAALAAIAAFARPPTSRFADVDGLPRHVADAVARANAADDAFAAACARHLRGGDAAAPAAAAAAEHAGDDLDDETRAAIDAAAAADVAAAAAAAAAAPIE